MADALSSLRDQRRAFDDAFDAIPAAGHAFRPDDATWSPAMVLEHLVRTEGGILWGLGRQIAAGDRRRDVGEPSDRAFAALRAFLRSGGKTRVPEGATRVVPTGETPLPELRAKWASFDDQWARLFGSLPPELDTVGLILHPRAGALTAERSAEFVADHIGHHQAQLGRLQRADGFPTA